MSSRRIGGKMADRALMPTVFTALGALVVALLTFVATPHVQPLAVVNVFVIGLLGMATVPPLQTVVLQRASTAPTLASAINIGAFNLGNAIAAWLGGLAIGAGFGYASVNWVGALMTLAGLGLAALSVVLSRQNPRSARSVAQAIIEQPG
mgnify:CR=1 FL=1